MDAELRTEAELTSAVQQAEAIIEGAEADVATVKQLANDLARAGASTRSSRRRSPSPGSTRTGSSSDRLVEFARTLRDHQQFGYAAGLLGRVRNAGKDSN